LTHLHIKNHSDNQSFNSAYSTKSAPLQHQALSERGMSIQKTNSGSTYAQKKMNEMTQMTNSVRAKQYKETMSSNSNQQPTQYKADQQEPAKQYNANSDTYASPFF